MRGGAREAALTESLGAESGKGKRSSQSERSTHKGNLLDRQKKVLVKKGGGGGKESDTLCGGSEKNNRKQMSGRSFAQGDPHR